MPFYLDTWIGAGTEDDPFRPALSASTDDYGTIDLRRFPDTGAGRCIVRCATPASVPGTTVKLADDPSDTVPQIIRTRIEQRLGLNAGDIPDVPFRRILRRLLVELADGVRWRPLQPQSINQNNSWEINCGGVVDVIPRIRGGASYADPFDGPNPLPSSPYLTWTVMSGSITIDDADVVKCTTTTEGRARAEHDHDTTDHWAEADCASGSPTSSASVSGVMVRYSSIADTAFVGTLQKGASGTDPLLLIQKLLSGTRSNLASKTQPSWTMGDRLRIECEGSSLRLYDLVRSTTIPYLVVTDTNNPSSLRGGILVRPATSATRPSTWVDNYASGDLTPSSRVSLKPISDISNTNWTPSAGTSLFEVFDDTDDSDYASSLSDTASSFEVEIQSPSGTPAAGYIAVLFSAWETNDTNNQLVFGLYQGATLISTATFVDTAVTATSQVKSWVLSQAERDAITDWTDLRVRCDMTRISGLNRPTRIGWIAVEVPAGGAATQDATAALSQTSTLSATGIREAFGSAALSQSSTLSGSGVRQPEANAALVQTSAIKADFDVIAPADVALVQTSTMEATGTAIPVAGVTLTQTSTLSAVADVTRFADSALVQNSVLSSAAIRVTDGTVNLLQNSTLSAVSLRIVLGDATLTQTSTVSVVAESGGVAGATLVQTSTFSTVAFADRIAAASLSQPTSLSLAPLATRLGVAGLAAPSILALVSLAQRVATAALLQHSTIDATGTRVGGYPIRVRYLGDFVLTESVLVRHPVTLEFVQPVAVSVKDRATGLFVPL